MDADAATEIAVGLVAQRGNERARSLATTLRDALEESDVTVTVDEETAAAVGGEGVPVAAMSGFDLVVSIGGDGTFLFVAREAGDAPLLGVNLGEVGFLNAVAPAETLETVADLVERLRTDGEIGCHEVDRLEVSGPDWDLPPALNEVVVHGPRRGHGGGATVEISIDGERYAESHVDGVLVATPTGSTAYNLSEGGPLLSPTLEALVVTQMCASDPMPPLVVEGDSEISLTITDAETGYVIADGRNRRPLEPPATVTVGVADTALTLAGPRVDFFEALEKLE
ncbi:NAD(+)/NADH kinase [Natronobiforma cellulositropha]|uniref:NAD(+)/NADH kinase n=1 Tax=Natronobiforma cellulositropha TaxID=1679076 RepID=UPI0021D58F2E|nr:NAD(+)/NADH kinase [Natronobiforma cellulositropha]